MFTLAGMDEKRALVCVAGPDKARITVTLGFRHDGRVITPEFNLKSSGKSGSEITYAKLLEPLERRYGKSAEFVVSPKAWATTTTVHAYIVREIFPLAREHGHVILYVDAFTGHFFNNSTKQADMGFITYCAANNVFIRYLPGGSTPFLQVGDTHIHRFVKSYVATRWAAVRLARLEAAAMSRSAAGNVAAQLDDEDLADLEEPAAREWVVGAVLDALRSLPEKVVKSAFLDNGLVGEDEFSFKIAQHLFNRKWYEHCSIDI